MLNFVGGKNVIVPAERSSPAQAADMCKGQGMELMDLKSLTELDSVKDFLGDIGKKLNHLYHKYTAKFRAILSLRLILRTLGFPYALKI
jgi:hypothetical protein